MKVCFFFEKFDRDVSSGTEHSMHQWHELAMAFGVDELAVVNTTGEEVRAINDSVRVTQYASLEDFCEMHPNHWFVEQGGPEHRDVDVPADDWIVFGGTRGLPRADLSIMCTNALYPREAAAIVLENQWARSR